MTLREAGTPCRGWCYRYGADYAAGALGMLVASIVYPEGSDWRAFALGAAFIGFWIAGRAIEWPRSRRSHSEGFR